MPLRRISASALPLSFNGQLWDSYADRDCLYLTLGWGEDAVAARPAFRCERAHRLGQLRRRTGWRVGDGSPVTPIPTAQIILDRVLPAPRVSGGSPRRVSRLVPVPCTSGSVDPQPRQHISNTMLVLCTRRAGAYYVHLPDYLNGYP